MRPSSLALTSQCHSLFLWSLFYKVNFSYESMQFEVFLLPVLFLLLFPSNSLKLCCFSLLILSYYCLLELLSSWLAIENEYPSFFVFILEPFWCKNLSSYSVWLLLIALSDVLSLSSPISASYFISIPSYGRSVMLPFVFLVNSSLFL